MCGSFGEWSVRLCLCTWVAGLTHRFSLFEPKRTHRVNPCGTSRGNPDGEQCDGAQQQGRRDESNRVQRFHAEKEACQKTREPESSSSADHHPKQSERHSLPDHHAPQV